MELYGPAKVGGDCLSYCGKCKMELAHVVVSMVGPKPARVVCKTCKSQHNYKGALSASVKRPTSSKPRVERTTVRAADYWEKKLSETKAVTKNYGVKETYKAGDVIQHAQFGVGIVEEVKLNGKIVVLFRTGDKVLVHGLQAPAAT